MSTTQPAKTPRASASPPAPSTSPGSGRAPEAPPEQPGDHPDAFDRRAHYPAGGVAVVRGRNDTAEWRLYAYRDDGKACVHFETHSATGGGAGAKCQKPPLDPSTSSSDRGRFGWGLTSPDVARVRFEHADGGAETFDTVTAAGFNERFYAGELARTPLKRIVALDAGGRVVAEKTDMTAYNLGP